MLRAPSRQESGITKPRVQLACSIAALFLCLGSAVGSAGDPDLPETDSKCAKLCKFGWNKQQVGINFSSGHDCERHLCLGVRHGHSREDESDQEPDAHTKRKSRLVQCNVLCESEWQHFDGAFKSAGECSRSICDKSRGKTMSESPQRPRHHASSAANRRMQMKARRDGIKFKKKFANGGFGSSLDPSVAQGRDIPRLKNTDIISSTGTRAALATEEKYTEQAETTRVAKTEDYQRHSRVHPEQSKQEIHFESTEHDGKAEGDRSLNKPAKSTQQVQTSFQVPTFEQQRPQQSSGSGYLADKVDSQDSESKTTMTPGTTTKETIAIATQLDKDPGTTDASKRETSKDRQTQDGVKGSQNSKNLEHKMYRKLLIAKHRAKQQASAEAMTSQKQIDDIKVLAGLRAEWIQRAALPTYKALEPKSFKLDSIYQEAPNLSEDALMTASASIKLSPVDKTLHSVVTDSTAAELLLQHSIQSSTNNEIASTVQMCQAPIIRDSFLSTMDSWKRTNPKSKSREILQAEQFETFKVGHEQSRNTVLTTTVAPQRSSAEDQPNDIDIASACHQHADCDPSEYCTIFNECLPGPMCTIRHTQPYTFPVDQYCPRHKIATSVQPTNRRTHGRRQTRLVARIEVCYSKCVSAIAFKYNDGSSYTWGNESATECHSKGVFDIPSSQYLSRITTRTGSLLSGVQFVTNKGNLSDWFGSWNGKHSQFKAKSRSEIWAIKLADGHCAPIDFLFEREF